MIAVSPNARPGLTALEWKIVRMAKTDGPHGLNPDGLWGRFARRLFGVSFPGPLANEGLEALRRFAVRAWYWNVVRPSELGALIDGGYSRANALQILEHIAAQRGCLPTVQDNLINLGSGLEATLAPCLRASRPDRALPAPRSPSLPLRRGQSLPIEGSQSCPCR